MIQRESAKDALKNAKDGLKNVEDKLKNAQDRLKNAQDKFNNAQDKYEHFSAKWMNESDPDMKTYYDEEMGRIGAEINWIGVGMDSIIMEINTTHQLVTHYTAEVTDFFQLTLPSIEFPDSFSLTRRTHKAFDHPPILLDAIIERALQHFNDQIHLSSTEGYRVPPLAITSMACSGKTTLLKALFNKILQEGQFDPVLVDFTASSGFSLQDGESDYHGFLRWVASSLLFDEDDLNPWPIFSCPEQQLEAYLSDAPKPIVLLVDELHALAGKRASASLARLLREMFLDRSDRCLCFTSEWGMDLDEEDEPNPRTTKFLGVPMTQDVEKINELLPGANVTSIELAMHAGIVGLIVSRYGWRQHN